MNRPLLAQVRRLRRVPAGDGGPAQPSADDKALAPGSQSGANRPIRVLIVEDSEDDMKLVLRALDRGGFDPTHRRVQTAVDLRAALAQERWDAVISDFRMPAFTGLDALRIVRSNGLDIPFILISGTVGEETAVDAMKAGASDFIMKQSLARLAPALERELRETEMRAAHRKAQRDLVESERRLRTVIETEPECVKVVNREGVLLEMNAAGLAMLEAGSLAAVQSRTLPEFIVPEHRTAFAALHQRVIDGENGSLEFEVIGLEGGRRWLETHAAPLGSANAEGAMLLGVTRDITARKRAEEELKESEARFRSLTALSSDWYWEQDEQFRFVRFSGGDLDGGWGKNQLSAVGLRRWDLPGVAPISGSWLEHKALLEAHEPFRNFEYRRILEDGSVQFVAGSGEPVFDAGGRFTGYRGVATDITERKRAEQDLRESERRFSDLLKNVELVSVMLDCEARITYCNEFLLRLTGWRLDEVTGRNWFEVFVPAEAGDMKPVFDSMLAGLPEARNRDNRIVTRSGERKLIRWNNSVLRSGDGEVIGTASIGEDVTEQKRGEESLRRFSAAMDATVDAIYLVDRTSMCIVYVNEAACRMTGTTREQLMARKPWEMLLLSRAELEHAYDVLIAGGGEALPVEVLRPRAGGTQAWIELRRHAQRSGDRWTIVTLVRDITERKEAEAKIIRLNRVYAVLSGINGAIVRIRERDALFREACRIAVEEGGFRMAWIGMVERGAMTIEPVASAGSNPEYLEFFAGKFSPAEEASAGDTLTARAIREKKPCFSNDTRNDPRIRFKRELAKSGTRSLAVLPLLAGDEVVGALVLHAGEIGFFDASEVRLLAELAGDISFALENIGRQERLDYLAYYDVLTGLANRSLFLERVAQHMRSAAAGGHKLALFLIDLERFKNINDSLGRPAGDTLLKQVAEWLTGNTEDASLVARVGADHFAAVLPAVRREGVVARLVERLVERWMQVFMEHPFRLDDGVFRISAKVGIALFPDDGADATTLYGNAEAALKRAKRRGDRYLFYAPGMTDTGASKLTLENQLRKALDNEEFVLHYQPKVNLASGRMTGAEALIRWNDPRTGLVPPGRFIPILEETGLIHDVGRWALRRAIQDYLRWRAAGLPAVRIAVNVSPLQLRNRGFIAEIEQVIGIGAHAAAGLELEITESLIMENVKHSVASLQAIRAMGVTIAIDDFGTGFSSLSYLAKLPVDTLKIDRSFVIDMTAGPDGLSLVSTIITLAHSLKLKVVAEGVETEEQSRLLRLLNCDEMQGYLFSKPVPADVFEARFLAPVTAE